MNGISSRTRVDLNVSLRVREERLPYPAFAKEEQYFLRPSDIVWNYKDDLRLPILPSKLGQLLSPGVSPEVTLPEVLEDAESEGIDARIQVFVIANDSVYGSTSYPIQEFRSKDFLTGDFAPGRRCTLLGAFEQNQNCCQFASSPWDFLLHHAYYRKIRLGRPELGSEVVDGAGTGHDRHSVEQPALTFREPSAGTQNGTNALVVKGKDQDGTLAA